MKGAVGIVPNLKKQRCPEFTEELIAWLNQIKVKVYLPACALVSLSSKHDVLHITGWKNKVDFAIVLGGDGSLLGAARGLGPLNIPILGVNLGHFGFLTELETSNAFDHLPQFLSGDYAVDERIMLSAYVVRNGEKIHQSRALNEACITRGHYGRLTVLSLKVSGKHVDTYEADGLIIATPTGSTAYSLSAGGPIVAPEIEAFIVSPICPHTLYSRSIVVPESESCEIEIILTGESTMLSLDGQEFFPLEKNDIIVVKKSRFKATLLRRKRWSFYDVLRKKMKEGTAKLPRGDAG